MTDRGRRDSNRPANDRVDQPARSAAVANEKVGLCATCRHARRIVSSKGSEFWLCELAELDKRFRKYPPLPVVRCLGYEPAER